MISRDRDHSETILPMTYMLFPKLRHAQHRTYSFWGSRHQNASKVPWGGGSIFRLDMGLMDNIKSECIMTLWSSLIQHCRRSTHQLSIPNLKLYSKKGPEHVLTFLYLAVTIAYQVDQSRKVCFSVVFTPLENTFHWNGFTWSDAPRADSDGWGPLNSF